MRIKPLKTVRLEHYKRTADCPTVVMPTPKKVVLPMLQHLGRSCTPTVTVGQTVKRGELIGDSSEFLTAPIHASISGKVTEIAEILTSSGTYTPAVVITASEEQETVPCEPLPCGTLAELIQSTRKLGMVGLGGAGFPTNIKLNPKNPDAVDTLLINGAECEPFITSDYREMIESADDLVAGIALLKPLLGVEKAIVAVEENKPEAIRILREKAGELFTVHQLPSNYPQGAEKVIIYHCTGRRVEEGQLPADQGVIVMNVTSLGNLIRGLKTGLPLTHKRVTVDGDCVAKPMNVLVPIGTPIRDLLAFCGGLTGTPEKLIMGGPMMGVPMYTDDYPILKNTNAILALSDDILRERPATQCIRCGKCIAACPFDLMPTAFARAYEERDAAELVRLKVGLCMECGCCAYVCPAHRPLVQSHRLSKQFLREQK